MAERRDRGALENEVLAALASVGRPMTAREVQAELGGEPAYTTVMTTLSRLYDKGALVREPAGRAFVYGLAGDGRTVDAAGTPRPVRPVRRARAERHVALSLLVSLLRAAHD